MSYVDDLLGAETPSRAVASYDTLCKLLQELRIPVSNSELCPPSTKITCLGIEVDSVQATLSVPDHKLQEILKSCKDFISTRHLQRNSFRA